MSSARSRQHSMVPEIIPAQSQARIGGFPRGYQCRDNRRHSSSTRNWPPKILYNKLSKLRPTGSRRWPTHSIRKPLHSVSPGAWLFDPEREACVCDAPDHDFAPLILDKPLGVWKELTNANILDESRLECQDIKCNRSRRSFLPSHVIMTIHSISLCRSCLFVKGDAKRNSPSVKVRDLP